MTLHPFQRNFHSHLRLIFGANSQVPFSLYPYCFWNDLLQWRSSCGSRRFQWKPRLLFGRMHSCNLCSINTMGWMPSRQLSVLVLKWFLSCEASTEESRLTVGNESKTRQPLRPTKCPMSSYSLRVATIQASSSYLCVLLSLANTLHVSTTTHSALWQMHRFKAISMLYYVMLMLSGIYQ